MTSSACANVPPPEVSRTIPGAALLGQSQLYFAMLFKVYDIELWIEDKLKVKNPWKYNQRFSISISYNIDITKESFVDTSIDEMKKYNNIDGREQDYRKQLSSIYKDVSSGDRISAIYIPNKEVSLYLNSSLMGKITDMRFAKEFLDIWLHKNSTYKDMQDELMGRAQ